MTLQEVEDGFKQAIKEATDSFVGDKLTENTRINIESVAKEAVYKYYRSLPQIVIEEYGIEIPTPRVWINGSGISIG